MKTLVQCPQCEGEGKISLPMHLQKTLDFVESKTSSVSSIEVQKRFKLNTPNAATNRLVDLLMLGLLKRVRDGKFWYYSKP